MHILRGGIQTPIAIGHHSIGCNESLALLDFKVKAIRINAYLDAHFTIIREFDELLVIATIHQIEGIDTTAIEICFVFHEHEERIMTV